jgi:benzoate-CoA ligase
MTDPVPASPPAEYNFAEDLLARHARRASKPAYIDDRAELTYGALNERVRRFAAGLESLGLRREERMLLLAHDTVDWPVAFLGALYAGVVPVAVNTLLTLTITPTCSRTAAHARPS